MSDAPDPAAWWSKLQPEPQKIWFEIITGWSLDNVVKAAFDQAVGMPPSANARIPAMHPDDPAVPEGAE